MNTIRTLLLSMFLLGFVHIGDAQNGSDHRQYNKAVDYLNTGKTQEALRLFNELCKDNNGSACFAIGVTYFYGDQVEKNVEKALEFLRKAIQKDNYKAMQMLGKIYFKGSEGIEKNPKRAAELFQKSLYHNDNDEFEKESKAITRQNATSGKNVVKNFPRLARLLGSAYLRRQDYASASNMYLLALTGPEIFSNTEEELWGMLLENAQIFASAAKDDNDLEIAHFLGDYFLRSTTPAKGIDYYKIASRGGNSKAQKELGMYYYKNNNLYNAIEYLESAVANSSGELMITCMEKLIPIYLENQQWHQAMEYSKTVMEKNDLQTMETNQDFFKVCVNGLSPYSEDWEHLGKTRNGTWYYNVHSLVQGEGTDSKYFIILKEVSSNYYGGRIFGAVFNPRKNEYYTYAELKGTGSDSFYDFPSEYDVVTTQYSGDLYTTIEKIFRSNF